MTSRMTPLALALALSAPLSAYGASEPVAEVANIRFHSDELMNLHHFLYAWAWRTRAQGRPLSQRLEAIPTAPFVPEERAAWDAAVASWRSLPSDDGAAYDKTITIDADALEPMVTYGTNPGMGIPITSMVPSPDAQPDAASRRALERALEYMDLRPGEPILGQKVDVVFVGSCTNGRISDLRLAASVLKDRRVADGVRVMIVPGSDEVKREAEREGLGEIFRAAGAEWREAGCSMCIAMNGDQLSPGQYAISTSNRNFEGRQGKGGRTFLASPLTAAASAIAGVVADPRRLPGIEGLAPVGGR
jgi:3-isopropylmalate/(R)-2-methylmalate dehydratase large subunit